ncbi:MAG: UDP-N-acetylglucosamine 2-epimerase (hydrolyzing) [Oscillospiraceae bacterium]|nr:MAG: UDP-N-acetylglucosamine 2-epimerase (hydrolyzing) [Oscillospiraceae bacterium]
MEKKTVCVVTGTRAEYGLLRGVVKALAQSRVLAVRLVVTGAHLAQEFGMTVREIEADGVPIDARIPILKFGTGTALATAKTTAYALEQFIEYFTAHRPDMVLVLGDRYEIFAAGQAAALLGIPLAHISGGDVTLGAADDYFRHCLTKMASLHFPACEEYAARVVRMGEAPETVHCVGGLGDENIRSLPLLEKDALAQSLGLALARPYALVTYHPETAGCASPTAQFRALLRALESFAGLDVIFTKSNADAGGAAINALIDEACAQKPGRWAAFTSLGVLRYLSAMKYATAVVGNSSSGVVETPTFRVPAVNIGARQKGRIICANVLCCEADEAGIRAALETALSPAFRRKAAGAKSPYDGGPTAARIAAALEQWVQSPAFGRPKTFYDAPCKEERA